MDGTGRRCRSMLQNRERRPRAVYESGTYSWCSALFEKIGKGQTRHSTGYGWWQESQSKRQPANLVSQQGGRPRDWEGGKGVWINAKMQTTRTDGQRGTTNGPVQTNEVRCHVPAPRRWACRRAVGSGQWSGGTGICAAVQVQLRDVAAAVSLADGALWPRGPRGPVRAPPSAHFRNREGSCRNPWVLGRRKLRPWDPCPHLRRRV